jgi:hypothetical protein
LGLHAETLILPDYRPVPDAAGANVPAADMAGAGVPSAGMAGGGLTLCAPLARDMAALIRQMEKCAGKRIIDIPFKAGYF